MRDAVDNLLNRVTMYRLVLYYLMALLVAAAGMGALGIMPYSPLSLLISTLIILGVCLATNTLFASVFNAQTNTESVYITALILVLIITPPRIVPFDFSALPLLFWASVWAMASKYIFALGKKHLFNPAAFAVAFIVLTLNQSAIWWIGGNLPLLVFVLVGGILVTRKLQRTDLVIGFLSAAAVSVLATASPGADRLETLRKALVHAPVLFFAFVMLTEPLTTPPTKLLRIVYGVLVGLLFAPGIHIGSVYSTPELALLVGNLFSYAASPKGKYLLTLKEKIRVSGDMYDFVFLPDRRISFHPGQYLEWTLGHGRTDSRGNRRYFTIASSPTEPEVRLGVKFNEPSSTFKRALVALEPEETIVAAQLAGEFVLPRNPSMKLAFIAGGIGITPFRSMVRYLMDTRDTRSVVLFYSNRSAEEIMYRNIFDRAEQQLHMKAVYTLTDIATVPSSWNGRTGYIDARTIAEEMPDYRERTFYLSGPRSLVVTFEKVLGGMGVPSGRIRTDFFPGFA